MNKKEDIVILGGGFVGLVLARKLVQSGVVGKTCEVTVIDKSTSHTYTPWLYEVSSGYLSRNDGRRGRCKLYTSASVPFTGIPGYRHVRFRHEAITGVDFQSKTVFLADGLTVRYSILVIALGTESNFFGIPGLEENAYPLKSASDAIEIERRVREVLAEATPFNKKHINVVGAGPTGVEFTGELMSAIRKLEVRGELVTDSVSVSLVDRKGPLSSFVPRVQAITSKRLSKLGVHLMAGLSVMSATDKALVLKDASGNVITKPSDLTIWSGGVMPVGVLKTLHLPMDPKGRILVDDKFAVKGIENVYCAGDSASLLNPISKESEPMTAQSGIFQAKWLARNLRAKLAGQEMRPYKFRKNWDALIAIGGKYGVGYVKGVVFKGPLAFYVRRIVDGRYFFWILPWPYAFKKWILGVILYDKND